MQFVTDYSRVLLSMRRALCVIICPYFHYLLYIVVFFGTTGHRHSCYLLSYVLMIIAPVTFFGTVYCCSSSTNCFIDYRETLSVYYLHLIFFTSPTVTYSQ